MNIINYQKNFPKSNLKINTTKKISMVCFQEKHRSQTQEDASKSFSFDLLSIKNPSKYVLHLCDLLDQNVLSHCSSPVFVLCFITLENESLIIYFVFTLFYYKGFGEQSADAGNREQLNLLSLERIWKQRRHQKMHWTKSSKFASILYTKRLDIMQSSQTFLCSIQGNLIASSLIR